MWRDEHTGLYHTHYRILNPNNVRWLTPDPKGYVDGKNLYRFYGGPNGVDVLGDERVDHNGKADENGKYWKVEKGDTLGGISQSITKKASNWKSIGYTGDPKKLKIGQVINIAGLYMKKFKFQPIKDGSNQHFINGMNAELLSLASAVYDTKGGARSFRRLGNKELITKLKIDPSKLKFHDGKRGFYSAVYTNDNGLYVYAIRGTEGEFLDIATDGVQAIGAGLVTRSYQMALTAGIEIQRGVHRVKGKLHGTGHSLGGGLTAFVAMVLDIEATTINAAGIHKNTLSPFDIKIDDKKQFILINNFTINGDILTFLQEDNVISKGLAVDALGNRIKITAPWFHNTWNPIYTFHWHVEMHKMGNVQQVFRFDKAKK